MPRDFFIQEDVTEVARGLLGKALFTRRGNVVCGGIITETEAYSEEERGCHAFGGRRTRRTEVMFRQGGFSYVYLCYGIHHMFNVVSGPEGIAQAVLVRGIYPLYGLDEMVRRRSVSVSPPRLADGPGKVAQALGIDLSFYGSDLRGDAIWIAGDAAIPSGFSIKHGPRVGIDYAGEDAFLPWRFRIENPASFFGD